MEDTEKVLADIFGYSCDKISTDNSDFGAFDDFDAIEGQLVEDDFKAMHSEVNSKSVGVTSHSKEQTAEMDYTEDLKNANLILNYDDKKFPICWDNDMTTQQIAEAIICACDAIVDSGFGLLDNNHKPIDLCNFNHFVDGMKDSKTELNLFEGKELEAFKPIIGDRMRKLNIPVTPLTHIEAQKAIKVMHEGSNLLKHINNGNPHIRFFQLSEDSNRLVYFSEVREIEETQVYLSCVYKLQTGQKSTKFKMYPIPTIEHLSFSLYYTDRNRKNPKTLDLT